MRTGLVIAIVLAACGGDSSGPGPSDASTTGGDGSQAGDGAIDGTTGARGVVCNDEMTSCMVPDQVCCDVFNGADTCIDEGDNCNGNQMACDGPEDCDGGQECCLFEGQGSRCLDAGICGTTGSISNTMCHGNMHCDSNEVCCGTSPGPVLDLYYTCRLGGACPQ